MSVELLYFSSFLAYNHTHKIKARTVNMITLKINTKEKHEISPYLYMQFMEPLGVCDSSVDAAWDFTENCWYPKVIDKVKELSPTMVRFGGCFASYYRWREGIGPFEKRTPMVNYCWGGIYQNQVGTHEIVDFCKRIDAEPLLVVNMESDGRMHWANPKNGTCRLGSAKEAAEWVSYCNDTEHPLRAANGSEQPFNIKYWQIGNETSYDEKGYSSDLGVDATKRFIEAMRDADPSIKLIGWGDTIISKDKTWCKKMSAVDGLDLIAFHHHFGSGLPDSPLVGTRYRADPDYTWKHMMNAYRSLEDHIAEMRSESGGRRLAMTEGHYGIPGRNRNEVLSSWMAGVSYARCLNVIMRNSDIIDIATMADFFGNVWQVNALMIPTPITNGEPYFQPVGAVMSLFSHHQGKKALDISYSGAIDAVASKTGDTVFVHIANTDMHYAQQIDLDLGTSLTSEAKMYYIAADPTCEINPSDRHCHAVREAVIEGGRFTLPAAAVASIEIKLA